MKIKTKDHKLTIAMPTEVKDAFKVIADSKGTNMTVVARELIYQYIKDNE